MDISRDSFDIVTSLYSLLINVKCCRDLDDSLKGLQNIKVRMYIDDIQSMILCKQRETLL